jgi:hypothetical protein
MKITLRGSGLVAAGLIIGLLGGFYLGFTVGAKPLREFSALATLAWTSQLAFMQYENASYPEARAALEQYILVAQGYAAHPELQFGHASHTDIAFAYTRLALLAEANGRPEEAPALMAKAVEAARTGGFRDPTEEHLRGLVQRISRRPRPTPTPGA